MRLLDAFCGAGGAAAGYHRAGFDVVGVDIAAQKRYPFEFHQGDAIEFIRQHGHEFDVIHASPPCQVYSVTSHLSNGSHPDLVAETREAILETGRPYIIENVPGAPLDNPLVLCGTMFGGLRVVRHRWFETWPAIFFPPAQCNHGKYTTFPDVGRGPNGDGWMTVCGNISGVAAARRAMGIDWMTGSELSQAIPPAYTAWLGRRILEASP